MDPGKRYSLFLALLSTIHYIISIAVLFCIHDGELIIGQSLFGWCLISVWIICIMDYEAAIICFGMMLLTPLITIILIIKNYAMHHIHAFQLNLILFNCLFHVILLTNIHIPQSLSILCLISFIVAITFIIIILFKVVYKPYKSNILLRFNIMIEILLSMYFIINISNQKTWIHLIFYFVFTIPFYKSYLIWKYFPIYKYITIDLRNDTDIILNSFYAELHMLSHHANENTKLLNKNTLNYHENDSVECWKLQYNFTCMTIAEKKKYIQKSRNIQSGCRQSISILYVICSVIAYLYPIGRMIFEYWMYHKFVNQLISNENICLFLVNSLIVVLYLIFFVGIIACIISNDCYSFWAIKYEIWLRSKRKYGNVIVSHTNMFCVDMTKINFVINFFGIDVGMLILEFCYTSSNQPIIGLHGHQLSVF